MRPSGLTVPWALALLLVLRAAGSSTTADKADEDSAAADEEDFTPEQLAKAGDNLARLYDEKLDANKDGKVSRQELVAWLVEAGRQQADRDLDEAWRAYNLTGDGADSLLDWETHAARIAAAHASPEAEEQEEDKAKRQAKFQAEVKRAIEEASRETGIERAGIKVGVPDFKAAAEPIKAAAESEQQKQQRERQLAIELGRDRRRWEAADADGDGRLSRREFAAFAMAEGAAAAAADGSTAVSPAMRRVLALEALERLDADGDGRVSLAEFLAGAPPAASAAPPTKQEAAESAAAAEDAKNFKDVWDVDKDGFLDADEMEKMLDYVDSAGTQDDGDASAEAEEADRLMRAADKDGDGSLSKAEALASLREFAGSAATDYGSSVGIHDEL